MYSRHPKILILGAGGQLGSDLCKQINGAIGLNSTQCNIANQYSVEQAFDTYYPDLVINAAALTHVDTCELWARYCFAVNTIGPAHIADCCKRYDIRLIHISSDFVFDGAKDKPYIEIDTPAPLNNLGYSKLMGEQLIAYICGHRKYMIVRTGGVFGTSNVRSKGGGGNFVERILIQAEQGQELRVISNRFTSLTYSHDLAAKIIQLIDISPRIIHIANEGYCSWYEFAQKILEYAGLNNTLIPIKYQDYPTLAMRPPYSCLDTTTLKRTVGGMRTWQEALFDYIQNRWC